MNRYQTYKPSGIEWMGEIPEQWKVKRVKDLTSKIGSGVTPSGGAEVYSDNGIPFYRSQNIYNNKLSIDDIVFISEEIDNSMSNSRIRPNDILLNITGASIGRCYYAPFNFKKGNVNQHVCIIRPIQKKIITNFLHFQIISQYGQSLIEISQNGANREGLNFQQIKNFVFGIPSFQEQTTIANYLDTKTTAIDRKIELLTAKSDKYKALRRSLINETVCHGLNPDATLKDSGIEWIGKIPEQWGVKRVKDQLDLLTGNSISDKTDYEDSNKSIPYVATKDIEINTCKIDYENGIYIPKNELKNFKTINSESILLCIEGGSAGKKIAFNTRKICFVNKLCSFSSKRKAVDLKYNFYQMQSTPWLFQFNQVLNGLIGGVSISLLKTFILITPPKDEQEKIANYLDNKTSQIDNVLTNITEQINKLTQLRKTLINDVVTGKIKVTE